MGPKTFGDILDQLDSHSSSVISSSDGASYSYSRVKSLAQSLASLLTSQGICYGDRVVIYLASSPEFIISDLAIMSIGAVSVPIFLDITESNLRYLIQNSGASAVIYAKILPTGFASLPLQINFDQLEASMLESPRRIIEKAVDLATIVYTSGSSGLPKGVMLTHQNIMFEIEAVTPLFNIGSKDLAISFLPLAHIFERMVCYFYISQGVNIVFLRDQKRLLEALLQFKPSLMTTVPRLLEKIYLKVKDKPIWLRPFIYWKIRRKLGGAMRLIICGGAPLAPSIARFFYKARLGLYQGYGMTETSPVISVNHPKAYKFESVGKALNGVEIKLATTDSELLVRGKNVMMGYYNQQTDIIDSDGFLHTGDIAEIDNDGFIIIKQRKKELFKTSGGKYISAIAIEKMLLDYSEVEAALIIAEGYKFVSAIIFCHQNEACNIPKIVENVNCNLNPHEQIKGFYISYIFPSVANGQMTPSQKLIRNNIAEAYQSEIIKIYSDQNHENH